MFSQSGILDHVVLSKYVCVAVECDDLLSSWLSYISSRSEALGEDHSGQTVSAVVQCGYSEFQHRILVLHRAQTQQAAKTEKN